MSSFKKNPRKNGSEQDAGLTGGVKSRKWIKRCWKKHPVNSFYIRQRNTSRYYKKLSSRQQSYFFDLSQSELTSPTTLKGLVEKFEK